ncbi:chromate transporter [Phenylobacterium immobile]|uniref:chromate transporter n=1 Tax=Phenylobacterium immobile TaxID=21 RepID=UPI000ACDEBAA|nr:chromate transporter [Phenylobacterium immobile]
MSEPSKFTEALAHESPHAHSYRDLTVAFLRIGLLGFGGVAASARRVLVAERRWFSDEDYAAILGMAQTLPGANTANLAVMIGDRAQGATGAMVALTALLAPPLALLLAIMAFYDQVQALPAVKALLHGMASVGAGMVFGTGLRMAWSLRRWPRRLIFGLLAIAAMVVGHVSIIVVAFGVGALSVAYAAWTMRQAGRPS